MNGMFFNCSSLKELNISNFYIKEEIETVDILKGCSDELKKKIKFHVDEFDEDFKALQEKVTELTKTNEALQYENQGKTGSCRCDTFAPDGR